MPFEKKVLGQTSVSYNLRPIHSGLRPEQRSLALTLLIRNEAPTQERTLTPTVTLRDSQGLLIPAYPLAERLNFAAVLTKTPKPENFSVTTHHQGTVTSTTSGETYNYSGESTYRKGNWFTEGQAINADATRDYGHTYSRWLQTYYLRDGYTVPPNTAVVACVEFPSTQQLPLRLTVTIDGQAFEFETITGAK